MRVCTRPCQLWDLNPRVRKHYDLNVTPSTTRANWRADDYFTTKNRFLGSSLLQRLPYPHTMLHKRPSYPYVPSRHILRPSFPTCTVSQARRLKHRNHRAVESVAVFQAVSTPPMTPRWSMNLSAVLLASSTWQQSYSYLIRSIQIGFCLYIHKAHAV